MSKSIKIPFYCGMVLLTLVSMWTTYISVRDSILDKPIIDLPLPWGTVWQCSVIALLLSVAIGMMLFSLKLAIIDEQKRLNTAGIVGLTIVAFISISFNMDVLYRTADEDFFMRYSSAKVKDVYAEYLAETQSILTEKRLALRKEVAAQEGELEAEIQGLREDPAGYGPKARKEEYALTKLAKVTQVELESMASALDSKQVADELLARTDIRSLDDIQELQDKLRVAAVDLAAYTGVQLPPVVELDNPFFAVFSRIFSLATIGWKEIFFLVLAFFLDLGDIVGYTMIPKGTKKAPTSAQANAVAGIPQFDGPQYVPEREEEDLPPNLDGPRPEPRLDLEYSRPSPSGESPFPDEERLKEEFFSGHAPEQDGEPPEDEPRAATADEPRHRGLRFRNR